MSETSQDSGETVDVGASWPAARRGWLLVGLLALASVISQFDRTVINLMVTPIKAEFGLNDTAFGALQGVAFGIFYVIACIPLGRAADCYNRRSIIAICLFAWSLFAMASGIARSYVELFLTRIGVAVGEAGLAPAGLSMLSDSFPMDRVGKPIAGFAMSAPIGQGLAYIVGGSLLTFLAGSPVIETGPLAGMEPWRAAFILVGAPGLLLVPLFLLVREPARRGTGIEAESLSHREAATAIWARRPALIPMFIGFAMPLLVSYSLAIWTPALLERTYGLSPSEVGLSLGLMFLICGTGGVFLAGFFSDVLARRGYLDAPLRIAAAAFGLAGIAGTAAPLMPTSGLALALLATTIFFGNMPFPCAAASLQLIVPNRLRGQVTAVYVTFSTLVGLGVGPTLIGLMTDFVFQSPSDLRFSMSVMIAVATPVMLAALILAMRPYRALRSEPNGETS